MKKTLILIIMAVACAVAITRLAGAGEAKGAAQLIVKATFTEIPGTGEFPNYPKGSVYYNHVAILKYEVVAVVQGEYEDEVIMVGQYMPRLARADIKDKMDEHVDGDVKEFKPGDVHRLVLDMPISKYWDRDDAVFDDYFDDEEGDRYFALVTDLVKEKE